MRWFRLDKGNQQLLIVKLRVTNKLCNLLNKIDLLRFFAIHLYYGADHLLLYLKRILIWLTFRLTQYKLNYPTMFRSVNNKKQINTQMLTFINTPILVYSIYKFAIWDWRTFSAFNKNKTTEKKPVCMFWPNMLHARTGGWRSRAKLKNK